MADPAVARLIAEALAAHQSYRISANKDQRQQAAIAIRAALAALTGAVALDPTRSDPAWQQGTFRTEIQLSDKMLAYYVRYAADADAKGL